MQTEGLVGGPNPAGMGPNPTTGVGPSPTGMGLRDAGPQSGSESPSCWSRCSSRAPPTST